MKKVIRLTESDLTRIVRRVIEEQSAKPDGRKMVNIAGEVRDNKDLNVKNLETYCKTFGSNLELDGKAKTQITNAIKKVASSVSGPSNPLNLYSSKSSGGANSAAIRDIIRNNIATPSGVCYFLNQYPSINGETFYDMVKGESTFKINTSGSWSDVARGFEDVLNTWERKSSDIQYEKGYSVNPLTGKTQKFK